MQSIFRVALPAITSLILCTSCAFHHWHASPTKPTDTAPSEILIPENKITAYITEFSIEDESLRRLRYPTDIDSIRHDFDRTLSNLPGLELGTGKPTSRKGTVIAISVTTRAINPLNMGLAFISIATGSIIPYYGDTVSYIVAYDIYVDRALIKTSSYKVSHTVFASLLLGLVTWPWLDDSWKLFDFVEPKIPSQKEVWLRDNSYSWTEGIRLGLAYTAQAFWHEAHNDKLL